MVHEEMFSTEWETHYTHTLYCNFVNSIMFENMFFVVVFFNQKASLVGVVRAKRKRKQTLVGQWQRGQDPSPSSHLVAGAGLRNSLDPSTVL